MKQGVLNAAEPRLILLDIGDLNSGPLDRGNIKHPARPYEVAGTEIVQLGGAGQDMAGNVEVCAGVGVQAEQFFGKAVLGDGADIADPGRLGAGIDRHGFGQDMAQVDNVHSRPAL